jgi:hypothetical protein
VIAAALAVLATTGAPVATPSTDFFVSSLHKTKNYGAVKELVAGRRKTYTGYARFALSAPLAPGQHAVLRLFGYANSTTGLIVRRASGGQWSERRVKYAKAPKLGTGGVASGPITKGQWTEVDVTRLVSGTTASFGFVTTSQSPVVVGSRESGAAAPQLAVR